MTQWQPIETAPKDGTKIIILNEEWSNIVITSWVRYTRVGVSGSYWAWRLPNTRNRKIVYTYWMPYLPPEVD